MGFQKLKLWTVVLPALITAACANPDSNRATVTTISGSAIAASDAAPADKAEEYAKSAELLLTAQGFMQADDFAKLALQQDPNNFRAQLIHTILGPLVLQRGVLTRMKTLAPENREAEAEYTKILDMMGLQVKNENIRNFLKIEDASVVPFKTETDLQNFARLTGDALEKLRLFILKSRDKSITFRASALLVPDLNARYIASCEIKTTANREYELVCPPAASRSMVQVDRGEFETIKSAIIYTEAELLIPSSYSLTGVTSALSKDVSVDQGETRKYLQRVLALPSFGKLNDAARMSAIRGWALDLVTGMRWAMKNQGTLCPKNYEEPSNRPGHLFNKGLCVSPYLAPYLAKVETAANIKAQSYEFNADGDSKTTTVNPMIFFTRPPSKLGSLGPVEFTACGGVAKVGDETLGGIFPNRDASFVLKSGTQCEAN